MFPENPGTSQSEADHVEWHTGQENNVCNGVMHKMAIEVENWVAFPIHQLFTTQ